MKAIPLDAIPMNASAAVPRNHPYNCWWVAALAHEVGRTLLPRWLLDTPVLLYRTEAGKVVAMEDRCPHRLAPLSLGTLQGDNVECAYHGFRFNPEGKCNRVPSLDSPPPYRVESYPVEESGPFVWIYLGDRGVINDVPPPPELSWATDADFTVLHGNMEVGANYMLLKENVLDLTHFGFLHAKTFAITDVVHPPEVEIGPDVVTYRQSFVESPLPAAYALALGLQPGVIWNRETYGSFLSPALQVSANDCLDPSRPGEPPMGRHRFAHATTPIDRGRMHYFWLMARDHGRSEEQMHQWGKVIQQGFAEDKSMLEAIQQLSDRAPRRGSSGERSVRADVAGLQARRILTQWMERETIPQS